MRLSAEICLCNRSLAQHNMRTSGKSTRSSLAMGKKAEEAFVLLCTAQNRAGNKYSLDGGNVERVFSRFSSEGKATIRMRSPPHDICVTKADPVALKAFLAIMAKVVQGDQASRSKLSLSALNPASSSQLSKPPTKMEVTEKKEYPVLKGFPTGLEVLRVAGISLKKVDSRIFGLRRLTQLHLPDNELTRVPEELGLLGCLKSIDLSGNRIESLPPDLLRRGRLRRTLKSLNLARNRISKLPGEIVFLESVHTMDLSSNRLRRVPLFLERLDRSLDHLALGGNPLETVPASLARMRLLSLQLDAVGCGRSSSPPSSSAVLVDTTGGSPAPLVDQCLGGIILRGQQREGGRAATAVTDPSEVPRSLVDLYESRLRCHVCGRWTFHSRQVRLVRLNLRSLVGLDLSIGAGAAASEVPAEAVLGPCGHTGTTEIL